MRKKNESTVLAQLRKELVIKEENLQRSQKSLAILWREKTTEDWDAIDEILSSGGDDDDQSDDGDDDSSQSRIGNESDDSIDIDQEQEPVNSERNESTDEVDVEFNFTAPSVLAPPSIKPAPPQVCIGFSLVQYLIL